MNLELDRVLFLDVETTGLLPMTDRVVQIALQLGQDSFHSLLDPEMRIPEEVIAIHGITNEQVKMQPRFSEIYQSLFRFVDPSKVDYVCGFNVRFDFKFLQGEFARTGRLIESKDYRFLDPLLIHKALTPNTLEAMYRRYTGKVLEGAHDSKQDMLATLELLSIQSQKAKKSLPELSDLSGINNITAGGWLKLVDGEYVLNQGKHKDKKLSQVVKTDSSFLHWVLGLKDIAVEEVVIIKGALC